jgi:hypothetical protein
MNNSEERAKDEQTAKVEPLDLGAGSAGDPTGSGSGHRGPNGFVEKDVLGLRAATFLVWLEEETDFGTWDESVKAEVNEELMACLGLRERPMGPNGFVENEQVGAADVALGSVHGGNCDDSRYKQVGSRPAYRGPKSFPGFWVSQAHERDPEKEKLALDALRKAMRDCIRQT